MKTRYRELKIALVDNQDVKFDFFFLPQNIKVFVSTSRRIFQHFRSSSSQRPGISKDYEHGKASALSGSFIPPRNPILVFHFFSSVGPRLLTMHSRPVNVSADSQFYI